MSDIDADINKINYLCDLDASSLIHEIINPLNTIVGYAEISKMENKKEDMMDNLDSIIEQSIWCSELLKDFLKNHNNIKEINVFELLTSILKQTKSNPLFKLKNIQFKLNIEDKNLTINSNRTYMKIIISNLLINALKYSKDNTEINIKVFKLDNNIFLRIINIVGFDIYNFNNLKLENFNGDNLKNEKLLSIKKNINNGSHIGLDLVDKLINYCNGTFSLIQDNNRIITNLSIPIKV
jgi:signal transduction histidine kinase